MPSSVASQALRSAAIVRADILTHNKNSGRLVLHVHSKHCHFNDNARTCKPEMEMQHTGYETQQPEVVARSTRCIATE